MLAPLFDTHDGCHIAVLFFILIQCQCAFESNRFVKWNSCLFEIWIIRFVKITVNMMMMCIVNSLETVYFFLTQMCEHTLTLLTKQTDIHGCVAHNIYWSSEQHRIIKHTLTVLSIKLCARIGPLPKLMTVSTVFFSSSFVFFHQLFSARFFVQTDENIKKIRIIFFFISLFDSQL